MREALFCLSLAASMREALFCLSLAASMREALFCLSLAASMREALFCLSLAAGETEGSHDGRTPETTNHHILKTMMVKLSRPPTLINLLSLEEPPQLKYSRPPTLINLVLLFNTRRFAASMAHRREGEALFCLSLAASIALRVACRALPSQRPRLAPQRRAGSRRSNGAATARRRRSDGAATA
jgi:hypothetical protein